MNIFSGREKYLGRRGEYLVAFLFQNQPVPINIGEGSWVECNGLLLPQLQAPHGQTCFRRCSRTSAAVVFGFSR